MGVESLVVETPVAVELLIGVPVAGALLAIVSVLACGEVVTLAVEDEAVLA